MRLFYSVVFYCLSLLNFGLLSPASAQTPKPEYRVVPLHDWVSPAPLRSMANGVSDGVVVGTLLDRPNYSAVNRAIAWNLADNSMTDLHAMGESQNAHSFVGGISEGRALGGTFLHTGGGGIRPALWDTAAPQRIRLRGPEQGAAESICGNLAVGTATFTHPQLRWQTFNVSQLAKTLFSGNPRWGKDDRLKTPSAVVWNLESNRIVSLHNWLKKGAYASSGATDISGDFVVGYALIMPNLSVNPQDDRHSYVWNLATRTATNLQEWTPPGFTHASGRSIWGKRLVGTARDSQNTPVAYLWNLETRETINLHEQIGGKYPYSEARAIAADRVVGTAGTANPDRTNAILWDLRMGTATNLHDTYLAKAGFIHTNATGIDSEGVIVGYGRRNGKDQAWALVPDVRYPRESRPKPTVNVGEPPYWLWGTVASLATLVIALVIGGAGRRRQHARKTP